MLHQAFKSAKDNLDYASTASGQNQIDYIKRAKDCFIDAVAVEENENKVLALVGLSMCQYMLGDTINAERSLDRIRNVELTKAEKVKYAALEALSYTPLNPTHIPGIVSLKARKESFSNLRYRAISTNRNLLS